MATLARQPYAKRDVPTEFQQGWWITELGNIQRAIPVAAQKQVVGGTYHPTTSDHALSCNTTTGAVTVVLPDPTRVQGMTLVITHTAGSAPVTISGTVSGVANPALPSPYNSMTIQSDGTQWLQIAHVP